MKDIGIKAEDLFLYFFFLCFISLGLFSIQWPIVHDTLTFLSIGREFVDYGALPYRDFHEENMPLVYVIYLSLSSILGATHFSFRFADLCLLLSSLGLVYYIFKNEISGKKLSLTLSLIGVCYFVMSKREVLQRDSFAIPFVLLLCISVIKIVESSDRNKLALNYFICALSVGFLISLKPYFLIWGGVGFLILLFNKKLPKRIIDYYFVLLGLIIFPLVSFAFLHKYGIMNDFTKIAIEYWPLYSKFNFYPSEVTSSTLEKLVLDLYHFLNFGRQETFVGLFLAVLSCYFLKSKNKDTRFTILLIFSLVSILLPAFSNRYLPHYYIPTLFIALPFALSIALKDFKNNKFIALFIAYFLISNAGRILWDKERYYRQYTETIALEQFSAITNHGGVKGSSVLTFGWAGDVSFSTLDKLKGRFANRYIYAQHFFHSMESDYVREIRRDFISKINSNLPKFIILDPLQHSYYEKLEGSSLETLFPEFKNIIDNHYSRIYYLHEGTKEYSVYQLRN